jgi:signal transduction histidine kinase
LLALLCTVTLGLAQTAITDSLAQQLKFDSAIQIVKKHKRDSTEIKALSWLGNFTASNDFRSSFTYFHKALRLSSDIAYQKLYPSVCNGLGELHHTQGNYDSSLFYHRKAIAAGLAINDIHEVIDGYDGISLTLRWLGQYDSAKFYLTNAQTAAKENNDYAGLANIYNSKGNLFLQENNHAEALEYYILAAHLQDSLVHDPRGQATALANIGNIQYKMDNLEKALHYVQEAQSIAEKNNLQKVLAYAAQQVGRIYRKQKKFDEAINAYKKALASYLRMGVKRNAAEIYQNLGNIYFDKADFKEAQHQYKTAIHLSKQISYDQLLGLLYHGMGSVFHQLKQYDAAFLYIDSARITGKKINDQYTLVDAYDLLAQISKEQHKYKEALTYFQQYADLKDSLTEAGNRNDMVELEMKYQNEKKVTEIELLKSDQALKSLTLSRQKVIITATIVAFIFAIAIGFLMVTRYRAINNAKRLIEIERVRNNIARDLHDDIGSTLSSINILSQVALMEKNGSVQNHLQRIGDQSARIMEDIGDMVWSVNPRNDSINQVIIRMREFATEILDLKKIDYIFNEKIAEGLTLTVDQRKNLFLIFKEVINNAAKYSHASLIDISLRQQGHILVLKITDDGRGFNEHETKAGNGLRNLRERAKEINGVFTLTSIAGKGTEVELGLPIA